jgi:Zn-dependent membrane protease YugP
MLADNGVYDVKIISVEGQLTDHYNPADRTVNLSPEVYHGRSVAAAAVASHECGHAVQHAKAYSWLQFRSAVVPAVNVASKIVQITLFIGVILMFSGNPIVLMIGVAALAVVTFFSFVTLPVEFDASRRALAWLQTNRGIMQTTTEHTEAKDALWWAAMTYVVAALSSLAMLLYYASMLAGGRRD